MVYSTLLYQVQMPEEPLTHRPNSDNGSVVWKKQHEHFQHRSERVAHLYKGSLSYKVHTNNYVYTKNNAYNIKQIKGLKHCPTTAWVLSDESNRCMMPQIKTSWWLLRKYPITNRFAKMKATGVWMSNKWKQQFTWFNTCESIRSLAMPWWKHQVSKKGPIIA